jgi:integrase/recombinase XerD
MPAQILPDPYFESSTKRWRVRIPAEQSESGKAERHSFATKGEAKGFRLAQEARIQNEGTNVHLLSSLERGVARQALDRLQGAFGGEAAPRLLEAVTEYLERRDARNRSKTFLAAYEEWAQWTVGRTRNGKQTSSAYKRQISQFLPRFTPLHDTIVCDITPNDVERALHSAVAPEHKQARNALLRVLRAVFNYAKEREWLTEPPIKAKLMRRDVGHREPSVLPPDQVVCLLAACQSLDPEMLPYYVLCLFAGIRPEDEMRQLRWENVFAGDGDQIHIPADIAKTRFQRHIPMEPVLREWLEYLDPPRIGFVTPQTSRVTKRRQAIQRAAGITPWPQDVMRHTFASYWMTIHRNEDRCRDAMGHRTKDQLVRHYRKHTSQKDAEAFWTVSPKMISKCKTLSVSQ